MRMIAMLNKDVPLSNVLNGLSHMTFGMGHRLSGIPSLSIYFGDTAQVRAFRTLSCKLNAGLLNTTVFSDFPHTMVGRSTEELITKVTQTPESEVNYYGCCFLAEEIDPQLQELADSCLQLKGYEPRLTEDSCSVLLEENKSSDDKVDDTPMKISLLLNTQGSLAKYINDIALASLNLGAKVPLNKQYLLNVRGLGETAYGLTNISFHSLTVVTTGKPYNGMREKAEQHSKLICSSSDVLTMVFGARTDVESVILQKSTRLFSEKLKEGDLTPVIQKKISDSPVAQRRSSFGNSDLEFFAREALINQKNSQTNPTSRQEMKEVTDDITSVSDLKN